MGTTLTGKRVQNTYDSLIKISDNDNLTGTAKILGDGLGNDSPIYLSTSQIGIGITPAYQFHTSGNAKIGGNLIISGNLTVNGTLTYLNVEDLAVEDPLIKLAKDNTANTLDIGLFGKYVATGTKYKGFFNDASDDKFKLFIGTTVEPTTTVDITASGYTVGTLVANLEGNVTGDLTGNSDTATGVLVTADSADTSRRMVFTESSNATDTDGRLFKDSASNFFYNPSTNILNVGTVSGNVTGGTISGTTGTFSGNVTSGQITITTPAVPIIFNESGHTGDGQWWRHVLDGGNMRFDVSLTGGSSFTTYDPVIKLNNDGSIIASGQVTIPETPTADAHAASKKYVDDNTGNADVAKRIEITVKNVSGSTLVKGAAVHASPTATPPSGNVIEVIGADNDVTGSMPSIGILSEEIADEAEGQCVMVGSVTGINTSSFTAGEELYIGSTPGVLTNTKPTSTSNQIQKIAVVIKSHASNGQIEVFGAGRANDVPNLVDRTITFDPSINVTASQGFGNIEIGGPSGGFIDLKAPASDDYDMRFIVSQGGNEITTASGDLKLNTSNTLALTLDSSQNAILQGNLDMPTAGSQIMVNAYNANNQEGGGIFFRDGFDVNNKYNLSIMARSKVDDGSPDGLSINANEGIAFSTGSNSYNERMYIDNSGNVGIGIDAVSKFHLKYSGGSYGSDSTSGFINQAETGRATQRLRSITDSPAELFFDIDGGIAWDISARDSSSNYDLMFYGRGSTVGYNQVAGPYVRFHQTGNVTISGSMNVQGTSGSTFYGIDFQRSGSGVTVPDLWGNGDTLVLGHDSSTPVIKIDTTQTTFVGDIITPTVQISNGQSYNENIRMFPSANNDYSSLVLGAVSGTGGTGSGQWTLVRYPAANSNKFTIRHNTLDIQTFTTNGNAFYANRLGVGNTSPTARLSVNEPVGSGDSRTTPVTVIHLGTSHPSVGYDGFGTSIVDYRRTYQESSSHAVNSIDFIERGNSSHDFGGAIDFNTKALSSGTVAPVRRMRIDYTGKIGINTTSIPGFLTIKGASTANNPMLRINCDQASSFIHSTETIAGSMTSGQTVINVIGRDGSNKNSAWMGYQFNGTAGANSNLLTFGHWGANHLLTIDGVGNTNIAGNLTISDLLLNTYTGTGSHVLKNASSNGTVLTLTTTGDSRNLYLQTDHIFSNGTFHLGDNSYNTKYRAATHIFENGAATFASTIQTTQITATNGLNYLKRNTDASLQLRSENTRSGLFITKPATDTVMGSALVLADESYRLGTASYYHMIMLQNGNTYFNQNLMVGTTSPIAYDTTGTRFHVKNDAGAGSVAEVARFEGSNDASGSGAVVRISTSNDRGMYLQAGRTGTVPYAEIGTTEYNGAKTLAIALDNSGNSTFNGSVTVNGGTTTFNNVGGDKKAAFRRTGGNNYSIEHDGASLYFYNESTGTANLTITNGGRVGINNNSPTEKPFEVNGGILVYTSRSGYDEDGIFFREGFTSGVLKYNCSILAKDHNGSFPDGISINGYDGISFCTGSNSRNQVGMFDVSGNFGVGIDPVSKMHLKYSGGSYGTEATSGFINEATTGRATMRLRSLTNNAAELFFDSNGAIRWDISVRNSSDNYRMNFYPQAATPSYTGVSAHTFHLEQNGDAYHSGSVGIGSSPTAKLSVIGTGSGNNPTLAVDCTSSLTFNHAVEVFAGNMTAGESVISLLGHSGSSRNSGYLGYIYSSSGSYDNQLTLGFWSNDHLVRLRPNGNFGIGVNPSYTLDVAGTARLKGHTTARLLMDTDGADASNYVGTINQYENAVYCGRGQASFLVAGNQNIRFGFGTGVTLAQSKMVMYAGGQVNIGTSSNYNGTRLNVEGDRMGVRTSNSSWGQFYIANPNDGEAAMAFGANGTGRPGGDSTYTRQWIMGVGPYSIGASKWALSNKYLTTTPAITIIESNGKTGIRKVSPTYQLDVVGDIRASADVIAYSDRRVKENIRTVDNALNKVSKLRGVNYTRKDIEDKSLKLGVIAQEVKEVLPEVVMKDDEGKYSVAYGNMAGVFIEAIKELKAEVESLKNEIKELKK